MYQRIGRQEIIDKQVVGAGIITIILIGIIASYIVVGIEENKEIQSYKEGPGSGGILTIKLIDSMTGNIIIGAGVTVNVYINCLNNTIFLAKSYSEKFTNLIGEVKILDLKTLAELTFIITVRYRNITQSFEENRVIGVGYDTITLSIYS